MDSRVPCSAKLGSIGYMTTAFHENNNNVIQSLWYVCTYAQEGIQVIVRLQYRVTKAKIYKKDKSKKPFSVKVSNWTVLHIFVVDCCFQNV